MANHLVPYILLYGRCEEALEFYKSIFGGSYDVMRVDQTPVASAMPADAGNRIVHASFTAESIAFMASAGRDIKPVDAEAGNVSMALSLDDAARGERIFKAFAADGNVGMPIDAALEWMLTLP